MKRKKIYSLGQNKKSIRYSTGLVVLIALLLPAYLYTNTDILNCRDCIYNKDNVIIRQSDLDESLLAVKTFYSYNKQNVDEDTLRKSALDQLIKDQKVVRYAESNNITVSDTELSSLYQLRITQNESEEKLLNKVKDYYGYNKQQYQEVLKIDILREKVQESIGIPLSEWY